MVVSEGWFAALLRTKIIARIAATVMRFETGPAPGVSHHFADRHRLSAKLAVAVARPECRSARRRPAIAFRGCASSSNTDGAATDLYRELDDTRFNLLVIGQAAPSVSLGDLVKMHVVAQDPANTAELARVGIGGPSFYLLRPDGHVGLCGASFDARCDRAISRRPRASEGCPRARAGGLMRATPCPIRRRCRILCRRIASFLLSNRTR